MVLCILFLVWNSHLCVQKWNPSLCWQRSPSRSHTGVHFSRHRSFTIIFRTKGEPDGADSGGSDIDIAEYSCGPRGPLSHFMADLCVTSGCHSCCHTGSFHRTGTCFWNCQHDQFCKSHAILIDISAVLESGSFLFRVSSWKNDETYKQNLFEVHLYLICFLW